MEEAPTTSFEITAPVVDDIDGVDECDSTVPYPVALSRVLGDLEAEDLRDLDDVSSDDSCLKVEHLETSFFKVITELRDALSS